MAWKPWKDVEKAVKKVTKEVYRPFKKVFKTELNRVIGDIKAEISRSPELRAALVVGGQIVGIPAPVTAAAVGSLRRPEEPKKGVIEPPVVTTPGIAPGKEIPRPESDLESWAWASKYLKVQQQVSQARAVKPPPGPAEELTIEKIALPAAGIGLLWWLS